MPSTCGCKEHELFTNGRTSPIFKVSNRKIKKNTVEYFRSEGLLGQYSNFLCQLCVAHVESCIEKGVKRKRDHVEEVIELIENKTLGNDYILRMASALGNYISGDLYEESQQIANQYEDVNTLKTFNVPFWLEKRNPVMTNFLFAAAKCTAMCPTKNACILTAIESVYKARNLKTVAPFAFCQNLICYYVSSSKTITNLTGCCRPAGSYETLKRWLRRISSTPITPSTDHDVVCFFDNSQVVARNWRVNYHYKSTASVITSTLNINLKTMLQKEPNFSPTQWLYHTHNQNVVPLVEIHLEEGFKDYNSIRNEYLLQFITSFKESIRCEGENIADAITDKMRGLNVPINGHQRNADPYDFVPAQHVQPEPTFTIGEPAMCNPCSYEAVKKVIQHIQHVSGISNGERAWSIGGCDGLPYTLGTRLQETNPELQNILLIPGHGHIEINAVKAIYKLLWDPVIADLAKQCGFNSIRAQVCAQNCSDHHKSYMFLEILLDSCLSEILFTFTKFCKKERAEVSLKNLYEYIGSSTDRRFAFLCDVTFNYLVAIKIYRAGIRRNNKRYIKAGKCQLFKLFFGFGMKNYQELAFKDIRTRILAPPDIRRFLEETESFTASGHASKGEGGDFILESINGKIKRWLPPGIPKQKHWLEVCRNADTLQEIREVISKQSGLKEGENKTTYHRDISKEVFEYRLRIRRCGYLDNTGNHDLQHSSISGQPLDNELIDFETQLNGNMRKYFKALSDGNDISRKIPLTPIFTTMEQRQKFHSVLNKTKKELMEMIEEGILQIRENGDTEEANTLTKFWFRTKAGTKAEMLVFFKEVTVAIENSTREYEESDTDSGGEERENM